MTPTACTPLKQQKHSSLQTEGSVIKYESAGARLPCEDRLQVSRGKGSNQ